MRLSGSKFLRLLNPVVLIVFPLITLMPAKVQAHPGGLNGSGCHNNRRTGDYHCHGGYSGGTGGSYGGSSGYSGGGLPAASPRLPICRDVEDKSIFVSLIRLNGANNQIIWKEEDHVAVIRGDSVLQGQAGKLYRYSVAGVSIRNFIASEGKPNLYSFDDGEWIAAEEVRYEGDTINTLLAANALAIHSEAYTTTTRQRQICV